MELPALVASGFIAAFVIAFLPLDRRPRAAGVVLALVPLALFAELLWLAPGVADGEVRQWSRDWVPSMGIALSFSLDGLSLLMGLLITGVGAAVVLYAGTYMGANPHLGRFYAYLFAFMASMLGLVLADNMIVMFVFWELTSITSFLLIGFDDQKLEARKAATQALLVTGGGGLALLGGLVLLAAEAGTFELSEVAAQGEQVRESGLALAILLLIGLGAFTKSAQFPFHFWLPGAMAAPTPVSAYLHSATMVKAGVYLLARLQPTLGGTTEWLWVLSIVGAVTFVVGAVVAVRQTDLKLVFAYSTVAALGALVLLLGLGGSAGVKAAIVFLFAHALYKSTLFLVAGIIDHETGTRDIRLLGGLRRTMPVTAVVAVLGGLSLAGVAPFMGFIGKETLLEAVLDAEGLARPILIGVGVLSGALFVVVAGMLVRTLIGQEQAPKHPHEAPLAMLAGPVLLAGAGLGLGIFPGLVSSLLLVPAATAAYGTEITSEVALWHGFNEALMLSLGSIALGVGLLAARRPFGGFADALLRAPGELRPSRLYEHSLEGLNTVASWQTRNLQTGFFRQYLLVGLATAMVLVVLAFVRDGNDADFSFSDVAFYELAIFGVVVAGALMAAFAKGRLSAVVALGAVGFGVSIIYALFGAPDLAMTQFLVETLTVMLFVLVFHRLPRLVVRSPLNVRLRDAAFSIGVGGVMAFLVLAAQERSFAPSIAEYYSENSVGLAYGRNVVNVILVDFRALDTLGEITVLAVAALGVFALVKLRRDGT